MNAALTYEAITARTEQEISAYLELATAHRAAAHVTGECIARGGALGVLSLWAGLVAELDGLLDDVFEADRARLSALLNADTAGVAPRRTEPSMRNQNERQQVLYVTLLPGVSPSRRGAVTRRHA